MRTRRIRREIQFAGVYVIKNITLDKCYVGSSDNILSRLHQHESQLIAGKHPCKAMQSDFDKNHHFSFDILEARPIRRSGARGLLDQAQRNQIYAKEREYMEKLGTLERGYNALPISDFVYSYREKEKASDE